MIFGIQLYLVVDDLLLFNSIGCLTIFHVFDNSHSLSTSPPLHLTPHTSLTQTLPSTPQSGMTCSPSSIHLEIAFHKPATSTLLLSTSPPHSPYISHTDSPVYSSTRDDLFSFFDTSGDCLSQAGNMHSLKRRQLHFAVECFADAAQMWTYCSSLCSVGQDPKLKVDEQPSLTKVAKII